MGYMFRPRLGLFYQVLLHIHCKQLGSQLALYELIYVRPVFLN